MSEAARYKVTRIKEPAPFVIAVFLGGVILVLRFFGIIGAYAAELSLCAVMFIYFSLELPAFKYQKDRLGDNIYYLGLLFTLGSMLEAFIEINLQPSILDAVLPNFGVALLTTALGVFLRTLCYQSDVTVYDIYAERRRKFAEYVQMLEAEMKESHKRLIQFRESLGNSLDQLGHAATTRTSEAVRAAKESLDLVEQQMVSFREKMSGLIQAFSEILAKLHEGSGRLVLEFEGLCQRVSAINVPDNLLLHAFTKLAGKIKQHTTLLESLSQSAERTSQQLSLFNDSLGTLTRTTEQQKQVAEENLQAAVKAVVDFKQELASLGSKLRDTVDALTEANKRLADVEHITEHQLNEQLTAIRKNREALQQELDKSRETFFQVHDAMVTTASLIVEKLRNSDRHL